MIPVGPSPRNAWGLSVDTVDLGRRREPEHPLRLPAQPQDLVLDLGRTALVVVDLQNDFCHPDGWLASIGVDITEARRPIEPTAALLPPLRDAGVPVVWLNWGNRPDRANLPPNVLHVYTPTGEGVGIGDPLPTRPESPVLTEGSWAAAVVEELQPFDERDVHVSKYRMSGFWDTPLDSILRGLDVATLLFAGVNADQCVLGTLMDAACLGYDCVLLTDCCATTSPSYCWDATIYNVKQSFGFVADGADLRKALEAR